MEVALTGLVVCEPIGRRQSFQTFRHIYSVPSQYWERVCEVFNRCLGEVLELIQ